MWKIVDDGEDLFWMNSELPWLLENARMLEFRFVDRSPLGTFVPWKKKKDVSGNIHSFNGLQFLQDCLSFSLSN